MDNTQAIDSTSRVGIYDPVVSSPTPLLERSESGTDLPTVNNLIPDAELLIQTFLPPELSESDVQFEIPDDHDPVPFCLPQLQTGFDVPFARGYSDELEEVSHISQEDWLKFVDGLNMAMTACPPLRVVSIVGQVLGLVPYHWAQIASIVMNVAAQTGMHILSKTIGDRFLRAANKRLFNPRGLTVRLCTTPAMLALLTDNPNPKKSAGQKAKGAVNAVGRGVGGLLMKVPLPMASKIVRKVADPVTHTPASHTAHNQLALPNPLVVRRLEVVEELALPVSFDVLPPSAPHGVVDRMNAWSVKMKTSRTKYTQLNVERRKRRLEAIESGNYEEYMKDYAQETMALAEKDQLGFWGNIQQWREKQRIQKDSNQYQMIHPGGPSLTPSPGAYSTNSGSYAGGAGYPSPGSYDAYGNPYPPPGPYNANNAYGDVAHNAGPSNPYGNAYPSQSQSGYASYGSVSSGPGFGRGRLGGRLGGDRRGGGLGGGPLGLVAGLVGQMLDSRNGGGAGASTSQMDGGAVQGRGLGGGLGGGRLGSALGAGLSSGRLGGGGLGGGRPSGGGFGGGQGGGGVLGGGPLGLLNSFLGPNETNLERKVRNDELKEYWNLNQVIWIVVMKKDKDADIADVEIADSPEDTEVLTDEQLRHEMDIEVAMEDIEGAMEAADNPKPRK